MKGYPKSRQRELGIDWTKRHREWVLERIAEMYKPKEILQMALTEFASEWDLGNPNNPIHQERFEALKGFVHAKIQQYAYNKQAVGVQRRISDLRREFRKDLEQHYREANKFARVRDLSTIKELAIRDKQFMAAVKAVEAIRVEIEGPGGGNGPVNVNVNTQVNVRTPLTLTEIDAELQRLLTDAGVDSSTAATFLAGTDQGTNGLPPHQEAVPPSLETAPGGLPHREAELETRDPSMDLPPGILPA